MLRTCAPYAQSCSLLPCKQGSTFTADLAATLQSVQSPANSARTPEVSYPFLRFDEDWSSFCSSSQLNGGFQHLKCLRFRDREHFYVTLSSEARGVYESYDHQYWGSGPQGEAGWILQRYLLGADWHLNSNWRLYSEVQAALANGRVGGPRPYDQDKPDLHQLFLDFSTRTADDKLTVRAGRQELQFGSGRLVEVRHGLNARISFDGMRATLSRPRLQLDGFVTRPTLQRSGFFNDVPDSYQIFWGVYAVKALSETSSLDAYYLGLNKKVQNFAAGDGHYVLHTFGTRFNRKQGHWDSDDELIGQVGTFAHGDIRAWSASGQQGYTIQRVPASPHFVLRTDVTSGDDDLRDQHLGTFFPLFARGKYFEEADLNGPLNTIDVIPSIDLHPSPAVSLSLSYGAFFRESVADGLYGYAGTLYRAAAESSAIDRTGKRNRPQLQLDKVCGSSRCVRTLFCGTISSRTATREGRELRHCVARPPLLKGCDNWLAALHFVIDAKEFPP